MSKIFLLIILAILTCPGCNMFKRHTANQPETEERAVALFRKLGGKITRDNYAPGNPVVSVDLNRTAVSDAGLKHFNWLGQVHMLNLALTNVGDAGLDHLQGLHQLRWLNLQYTHITDAGLEHLQGLNQLQMLFLSNTAVTDVGLDYLRGLPQLQSLDLSQTNVTVQGVAKLKGALPNCNIISNPQW